MLEVSLKMGGPMVLARLLLVADRGLRSLPCGLGGRSDGRRRQTGSARVFSDLAVESHGPFRTLPNGPYLGWEGHPITSH